MPLQAQAAGLQSSSERLSAETCLGLQPVAWSETRSQSFALLYPAGDEEANRALALFDPETLDSEYARFAALFETSLALPISIRVYPSETYYYCLNAAAPEIPAGSMHSHIGAREIAFIADNIRGNFHGWAGNFQELFRYEQAVLFAEQVTDGRSPPGLLTAIGHYAQDPFRIIAPLQLARGDGDTTSLSWQELWESQDVQGDFGRELHATSTVAFLLDRYGWTPFLQFLQSLPASQSYRSSLAQAYGEDFAELDAQWQAYVPGYFAGRWQTNLIYNYDLSPYEDQLKAGNYAEAASGLQEAIAFLEKINQTRTLYEARALLAQAQAGAEANDLVIQSRQALARGEYVESIALIDQAQQKYSLIRYFQRMDELNAYRSQVQEIIQLHNELERMQAELEARRGGLSMASRVVELGQRLGELGDVRGQEQVRELARQVEADQRDRQMLAAGLGAVLALLLLGLRIALLWRKPAPEAEL